MSARRGDGRGEGRRAGVRSVQRRPTARETPRWRHRVRGDAFELFGGGGETGRDLGYGGGVVGRSGHAGNDVAALHDPVGHLIGGIEHVRSLADLVFAVDEPVGRRGGGLIDLLDMSPSAVSVAAAVFRPCS